MALLTEKTRLSSVEEAQNENLLTMPEKATLSTTTTVCTLPESPRPSAPQTPRTENSANPFDTDIEAMISHSSAGKSMRKSLTMTRKSDCQVWPGKQHWEDKAKAAKKSRACTPLAQLNPRTRCITKVVLLLFIVAAAVGIGFGVSKPLGAPIWGKKDV